MTDMERVRTGPSSKRPSIAAIVVAGAGGLVSSAPAASPPVILDRADYADRLEAMWLAQCIANWTGLLTEGRWREPPFGTDADWGTVNPRGELIDFVTDQDPWQADDDTDIEYTYLHLMTQAGTQHGSARLTPEQIRDGWVAHINDFIFVSNANARALMDRGVLPPATGTPPANRGWNKIDAQLTTEFWGALAPGMPDVALDLALLPMRTTAHGFALHAAQFHTVQYALAPLLDRSLPPRDQAIWLVTEARKWIPDSSKSADAIDLVLDDYLANPDIDDWERTRDLIHDTFQADLFGDGYIYQSWFESTVNLATGVMALLYGEMDLPRTIQIGTLSGWDSDNPTATMAALLGLIHGTDAVRAAFPDADLSERYWAHRTRPTLPDLLPDDPEAEDTFAMMAQRMLALADGVIEDAGGATDAFGNRWLLPPPPDPVNGSFWAHNPAAQVGAQSANNTVRKNGGTVGSFMSAVPVIADTTYGFPQRTWFTNGFEFNFDGPETAQVQGRFTSTLGAGLATGETVTLRVTYSAPVTADKVVLIEGDHFPRPGQADPVEGGWFESLALSVRIDGVWQAPPGGATLVTPLDSAVPFQFLTFELAQPTVITGVELVGLPGGADRFVTIAEIDVLTPEPTPPPRRTYDQNGDGTLGVEDLFRWYADPADVDGDGDADDDDARLIEQAVRWNERADMTAGQRP